MRTVKEWMTTEDYDGPEELIKAIQIDALNHAAEIIRSNEKYRETDYNDSNLLINAIEKLGGTATILR